jgi:hypothetical protein
MDFHHDIYISKINHIISNVIVLALLIRNSLVLPSLFYEQQWIEIYIHDFGKQTCTQAHSNDTDSFQLITYLC